MTLWYTNSRIAKGDRQLKKKVLVVEDSATIQKLIDMYIGYFAPYETIYLSSLAETENLLEQDNVAEYICAILDLTLPDSANGEILDLVNTFNLPIIILTASMERAINITIEFSHVIDYVQKRNIHELEHVALKVKELYLNQFTKVLVVDDSKFFVSHIKRMLDKINLEVLTAYDGVQAWQCIKENPDLSLVITDLNMPNMNGLDLLEKIRQKYKRDEISVVGISAESEKGTAMKFLKSGANDFISKPPMMEELYCRVQNTINELRYIDTIKQLATTDHLTQLINRREFMLKGKVLYQESLDNNKVIAVAMIDADNFKGVNDHFGHDGGDVVLVKLANVIQSCLPEGALFARYGGDEMVCMAKVESLDVAEKMFERVRQSVQDADINFKMKLIHVTVSIGFTTGYGDRLESMITNADRALYAAKENGRNCVMVV